MRYSRLLISTKNISIKAKETYSQELLVKAGYVRQLSSGIFSALHFGQRSFQKIEKIIREEMDAIGGTEISMPVVHPADLWKQTNRYYEVDESLVKFQDRAGRDMVLGMTHEEVVASLAKSEVTTHKQLPKLVYQIQTKFRDEARARGGLIRVREFVMKDSYSLDKDWEGLAAQYDNHYHAYFKIFQRAGLPVISVKSDVGMMGGKVAHEYMYITEIGEDTLFICDETGYRANKEVATFKKPAPSTAEELPVEELHTPATSTIEGLAKLLGIKAEDCGKVVFFEGEVNGEKTVVIAVVRGDMEVNTVKLQKATGSKYLKPATEDQIKALGAYPGFASPIGLDRSQCVVVTDDLIEGSKNLVMGANKQDYHLKNVCAGRDYKADTTADIVSAYEGAVAPNATDESQVLRAVRGVETGNIFQLGTKYTAGLGACFVDENGKSQPIIMGSYGIGVGRLLACLAEEYYDENGLIMPITVAPYQVHLVGLLNNEEVTREADQLYESLQKAGVEVLYDDRHFKTASNGEKFGDADLIGIPIRLTVSKRSLQNGGAEIKLRGQSASQMISTENVVTEVKALIAEISKSVIRKYRPGGTGQEIRKIVNQ